MFKILENFANNLQSFISGVKQPLMIYDLDTGIEEDLAYDITQFEKKIISDLKKNKDYKNGKLFLCFQDHARPWGEFGYYEFSLKTKEEMQIAQLTQPLRAPTIIFTCQKYKK